ncbi:MAG: FRG domain-containing protein [Treponema sp.]|nr:FRG domain-containing protein [Treponema sp.]
MDIDIKSVSEYIEKCFSNPALKKDKTQVFYRGVNQIYSEPHKPSIYYDDGLIENEDIIFKEAISFFPHELLAQKTTVEKLIFLQHYRFPTRIMDISKNPLITLFFACFPDKNPETLQKEGAVYRFNVPQENIKYCDSDAVSVIANLCKRPIDFSVRDIFHLEKKEFNKEDEILYLVHEINEEKPYFHNLIEKNDINSVVCLRPRMNNPRIVRQDGYFFLFGIDFEKKKCAKINHNWIDEKKFIVPHDAKKNILEELDKLNINESFVFPDYEHVSNHIWKKHWKQKTK